MTVSAEHRNWIEALHAHLEEGRVSESSPQSQLEGFRRAHPNLEQQVHRCLTADLVATQHGHARDAAQRNSVAEFLTEAGWLTAVRGSRQRLAALWPVSPTTNRGQGRRATMTQSAVGEAARTLCRHLRDGDPLTKAKVEAAAACSTSVRNHAHRAYLPQPDEVGRTVAAVVSRLVEGLDDVASHAVASFGGSWQLLWSPRAVRLGYGSTRLYDMVRATSPCAPVGHRLSGMTLFAADPVVSRWLLLRDGRQVEHRGALPAVLPADVQTIVDAAAVLTAGDTASTDGPQLSVAVLQALEPTAA